MCLVKKVMIFVVNKPSMTLYMNREPTGSSKYETGQNNTWPRPVMSAPNPWHRAPCAASPGGMQDSLSYPLRFDFVGVIYTRRMKQRARQQKGFARSNSWKQRIFSTGSHECVESSMAHQA